MVQYFGLKAAVNISTTYGDGDIMHVLRRSETALIVSLGRDEVRLITNALNEVCNGLDIQDFSIRLGAELEEAKALLNDLAGVIESDADI